MSAFFERHCQHASPPAWADDAGPPCHVAMPDRYDVGAARTAAWPRGCRTQSEYRYPKQKPAPTKSQGCKMARPKSPSQKCRRSISCRNGRNGDRSHFPANAPDSWENEKARVRRPECRIRSTQQEHLWHVAEYRCKGLCAVPKPSVSAAIPRFTISVAVLVTTSMLIGRGGGGSNTSPGHLVCVKAALRPALRNPVRRTHTDPEDCCARRPKARAAPRLHVRMIPSFPPTISVARLFSRQTSMYA